MPLAGHRPLRLALLYGATALFLLVPPGRHPSRALFLFEFAIVGALLLLLFVPLFDRKRRTEESVLGRNLRWICALYALWVVLSALLHDLALRRLDGSEVLTGAGWTAAQLLPGVATFALYHLLLPASIVFGLDLFAGLERRASAMALLPALAAPSVAVALAQSLGEHDWLNVAFFAARGQSAGLGHDANSLAASLALLLPWGLLGLVTVRGRWIRLAIGASLALLAAGIWVAGSRAGLLAALLVLLLAAPLLVKRTREGGKGRRRTLVWIVAVVCVLGVVALALASSGQGSTAGRRLGSTLEQLRTEGLARTLEGSGRTHYSRQAVRMIAASPLAGWGPGGYLRQLDNVRYRHDDLSDQFEIDNATNAYLQVAVELGLPAALLLVAMLGLPLFAALRKWRAPKAGEGQSALTVPAIALAVVAPLFLLNHYVLLPDVTWLAGLLIAFVASEAAAAPSAGAPRPGRWRLVAVALSTLVFGAATYAHSFGADGYESTIRSDRWPLRYEANCYEIEPWEVGPGRWCGRAAWWSVPLSGEAVRSLTLLVRVGHPDVAEQPVEVRIGTRTDAGLVHTFTDGGWHRVLLPIAAGATQACVDPRARGRDCLAIRIEPSRTFRPSAWGLGADERELGVAVVPAAEAIDPIALLSPEERRRLLFADGFESGDWSEWRLGTLELEADDGSDAVRIESREE